MQATYEHFDDYLQDANQQDPRHVTIIGRDR